jgi:predicted DNA-binding transcriptional regulator
VIVPHAWFRLRGNEYLILTLLASYGPESVFVSAQTVSMITGMAETHVYAAIRALIKRGFVKRGALKNGRSTYAVVTESVSPTDEIRQSVVTKSVSPLKERDQTSRSDHRTDMADSAEPVHTTLAQCDQPLGGEREMARIVRGSVKLGGEQADRPVRTPRPKSPLEQSVDRLIAYAGQKTFMPLIYDESHRRVWRKLLASENGKENAVQRIILEANARRRELLTEKYPVWSVHTIYFYATYKRVKAEPLTEDQIVHELSFFVTNGKVYESELAPLREFVALHDVSESTLRRALGGDVFESVYPQGLQ